MKTFIQVKAIKAKKISTEKIQNRIINTLDQQGREVVREFEKTTQTWDNEKPTFEAQVDISGMLNKSKDVTLVVGPTGNVQGVKKWNWLNFGTKIRYAMMSRNWRSKTAPGVIESGTGDGYVTVRGKKAFDRLGLVPNRGIEARKWIEAISKKRSKPFRDAIIQAAKIEKGDYED